jgi:hypothetical protein
MLHQMAKTIKKNLQRKKPNAIIGGELGIPYLDIPYGLRWYVIPRNPFFNIYLHNFKRSDEDEAHHDHGWLFNFSILIQGQYTEHMIKKGGIEQVKTLTAGHVKWRWGRSPHRLELRHGEVWTLFFTGPRIMKWGFYCKQGWVPFDNFLSTKKALGKGCF